MDEITDDQIKTVAVAICTAHGFDPNESVPDGDKHILDKSRYVPRWLLLRQQAITHIAAYRACAGFR